MRAGTHQRDDSQMKRCLTAGRRNSTYAAFQRRDPLLEHGVGGVAEPRIHVSGALNVEQRCRVIRVGEAKGCRLVDRCRSRARRGIRLRTGM